VKRVDAVINAPNGTYRGRFPELFCRRRLIEHRLSTELANDVLGVVELRLRCGRADVANATDVFEVEPINAWTHGLQQVFAYAYETGLHPNLALFGEGGNGALNVYLILRQLSPRVSLWLHTGWEWRRITNREDAQRRMRLKSLVDFDREEQEYAAELQFAAQHR
jgi:hypothetical protein